MLQETIYEQPLEVRPYPEVFALDVTSTAPLIVVAGTSVRNPCAFEKLRLLIQQFLANSPITMSCL